MAYKVNVQAKTFLLVSCFQENVMKSKKILNTPLTKNTPDIKMLNKISSKKTVYPLDIVILKESTYIVEQLLSFDSLHLHNIFSERTKNLVLICNVWSIKQDSKTILLLIMHSNTTARLNVIFA